jgi:hypothetical protein
MLREENSKYGDRDITSGSLVFSRSKGGKAGDEPLPEKFGNQIPLFPCLGKLKSKNTRKSAHQLCWIGDYIVVRCSRPQRAPSPM